jgi:hypothetical protein
VFIRVLLFSRLLLLQAGETLHCRPASGKVEKARLGGPRRNGAKRMNRVAYLLLATLALGNSGCLAVAVGTAAAGGAVGYAYYKGNVNQEFNAGFNETWAAAQLALADLGLPLVAAGRSTEVDGFLESRTGEGEAIRVSLETRPGKVPAEGPVTRVHVRVAWFGDRPLSDRLLAQVQTRLMTPAPATAAPATTAGAAPQVVPAAGKQTDEPPLAR